MKKMIVTMESVHALQNVGLCETKTFCKPYYTLCVEPKHIIGMSIWALSRHMFKIYTFKMC
jgi:hypothetical protein